jgi:hypothetical protein
MVGLPFLHISGDLALLRRLFVAFVDEPRRAERGAR